MPLLAAKFSLEVSSPCLIEWPEDEIPPEVVTTLDGHDVVAKLVFDGSWAAGKVASTLWTYRIQVLEIVVSRNEADACPDVMVNSDGTRDLTGQGAYLQSKLPAYQKVARETANRILSFFQYSLFTPLVRPVSVWDQSLHSPTWLDASGKELRGDYVVIAEPVPGVNGEFGVRKLTQAILPELQNFLATPAEPSLALALLSDAQTAWFEGGLRRSVLELAICTEVMVKRRFFAKDTAAGAAFDYMEDKAKVSIRVLDVMFQ